MQLKETLIALVILLAILVVFAILGDKMPPPVNGWKTAIIIVSLVLMALVLVFFIIQKVLAVKSAMAIERKLKAQASEQIAGARPGQKPQLEALQNQLNEAIQALKVSKMGKGALYSLPWYMIIGPPGSGKTTALQESGLNFPFTSQGGRGIRGVGGTRNCDWWFTDQGILLDTAGRYTTELEDRDEWLGFLDMLKKTRKQKPINGVIVAIAVSDLINATEEELEAHSKNIRDRVDELSKQLQMIFPVYLIFTKCDLLNGFVDFFEDFTKDDRKQMWGMSFPYTAKAGIDFGKHFEEECKKSFGKLASLRVGALSTERKREKKRAIYQFPLQFALAHKKLSEFVGMLFRPNPFQESPILRGVFFTSGTQEGFPIDQVVGNLSAAFGLKEEAIPMASGEVDKKSYFINHLFTKLIFPDQGLARLSSGVLQMQRLVRWAAGAGSAILLVLTGFWLIVNYVNNRSLLKNLEALAVNVNKADKSDLVNRFEAVSELQKKIQELDAMDKEGVPFDMWALYRGGALDTNKSILHDAKKRFDRELEDLVLESLDTLMEKTLKARAEVAKQTATAQDYEDLHRLNYTYQVLAGKTLQEDPQDKNMVERVLKTKYNPAANQTLWIEAIMHGKAPSDKVRDLALSQLSFFLGHMRRGRRYLKNLNEPLVNQVKDILTRGLWISAVYQLLKTGSTTQVTYAPVTVQSIVGSAQGRKFLDPAVVKNVPGAFTQEGYDGYFKTNIKIKSEELADRFVAMDYTGKTAKDVAAQLNEYFLNDYKRYWDDFLGSIQVRAFKDLDEAKDCLDAFSVKGNSALGELFKGVWDRRKITIGDTTYNSPEDEMGWKDDALGSYEHVANALGEFKGKQYSFQIYVDTGGLQAIDKAFSEGRKALDKAIRGIKAKEKLKKMAEEILKQPATRVLETLQRTARDKMNLLWKESILDPFAQDLKNRYPFKPDAVKDAGIVRFGGLFGYEKKKEVEPGQFWQVYKYISALSNTLISGKALLNMTKEFTDTVEHAELFRDILYQGEGDAKTKISVRFKMKFERAPGITGIRIKLAGSEIDVIGKLMTLRFGDVEWIQDSKTHLVVTYENRETISLYDDTGTGQEWRLFRMLDKGGIQQETATRFKLSWKYKANMHMNAWIEATSTRNPFGQVELSGGRKRKFFQGFDCPPVVAR